MVGDANFCSFSCFDQDYPADVKSIANLATDFYLEESMTQLIEQPTRTELRGNLVQKSCIDHITTNSPGKCTNTAVIVGGNSDHLAVVTTKVSKEVNSRPPLIKKRSYKKFIEENFLLEIKNTDFNTILDMNDVDEASNYFEKIFSQILDNHAPVKTFQTRTNYAPWLSKTTKADIELRNELKKQSITSNDPDILKKYKSLRNKIKARLPGEENLYYKEKFNHKDTTIKDVWKTSYEILGQNKDLSPKQLSYNGNLITSPEKLANAFNDIFLDKVKKLKSEVPEDVSIDPLERLAQWLRKRENPIRPFNVQPIAKSDLQKILKKLKGNRSSGVDQIDSFSLKLAAPYLEDVLLHLVNLSLAKYP